MRILLGLLAFLGTVTPFQASSPTLSPFDVFLEGAASRPAGSTLQNRQGIEPPEFPNRPYSLNGLTSKQPLSITGRSHSARLPLVRRQHQHDHGQLLVRHSYALSLDDTSYPSNESYQTGRKQLLRLRDILLRGGGGTAEQRQVGERSQWQTITNILLLTVATVVGLEVSSRIAGPSLVENTRMLMAQAIAPLFSVAFWSNLAPMASIALKLSPMPSIMRISREKTTGGLPLLPYSAMCTMTFCLVIYGLLVGDARIVGTHGAGHLLSLFYCATFVKHYDYASEKTTDTGNSLSLRSKSEIGTHFRWGAGIATGLVASVAFLGREAAAPVAGTASVVLSCLMYTGPLVALKEAIRSRSARNIPLPYALASIVNAIAWTVYGYFKRHDWMVWAPGSIGLVSAGMQVAVNIVYGSSDEQAE